MKISVTQNEGIDIVHLKGRIIYESENYLKTEIEKLIEKEGKPLVLDLAELSYINSSGLGILINLLKRNKGMGGDLYLASPSKEIRELFRITSLDHVFKLFDDTESAISAFLNK